MAENTEKTTAPEAELEEEILTEETAEQEAPAEEAAPEEPQVSEEDAKIAALTERLQRNLAEFDNFRKRTEKEKAMQFEMGARSVVEKILPVIDNFERGLAHISEEQKADPFVDGMDKVYRQMLSELEAIGVKPIEAVGQPFDPNRHNAVMHVEDESVGENMVVAEFQKGYTYRDSIVRYSMVQVAN